ncbi:hypothetical protein F3J11_27845, partial [Burkholderia sp. Cy-647]|nr:hypothetical protein [Burkholderia sp. Cy-647]
MARPRRLRTGFRTSQRLDSTQDGRRTEIARGCRSRLPHSRTQSIRTMQTREDALALDRDDPLAPLRERFA